MVSERTQRYNNRRKVPKTRRRNGDGVIRLLLNKEASGCSNKRQCDGSRWIGQKWGTCCHGVYPLREQACTQWFVFNPISAADKNRCRYSVPGQAFSRCFSLKSLAVSKSSPDCMHAHNPVRYLRITAQMACIFLFPRPTSEL